MSTLKVPLVGTNVTPSSESETPGHTLMDFGQGEAPEPVRGGDDQRIRPAFNGRDNSLHRLRWGQTMARNAEARAQAEARASEPAPTPSPSPQTSEVSDLQRQIADLKQQLTTLQNPQQRQYADGMLGELQRRTAEIPQYGGGYDQQYSDSPDYGGAPDPNNYDLYDAYGQAEYKRDLDTWAMGVGGKAVEAERNAQQLASDEERYRADIAATQKRFGRDKNFQEIQAQAAQIVIASGGRVLLEEAYEAVSADVEARSGKRGTSYLPEHLRGSRDFRGKHRVAGLGAIMQYHRETGRAASKRGR